MPSFRSFHFHAGEQGREALSPGDLVPMAELEGMEAAEPGPRRAVAEKSFNNDEAAARHFLSAIWEREGEGPLLGITAPESPEIVPDLRFGSVQQSPTTSTHLLHFDQTANSLPVLGAKAVVELNGDRGLVSIDAKIADAPDVSPIATLSPAGALDRVAAKVGVATADLGSPPPPALSYYHHEGESWHLVYEARGIPFAPPEFRQAVEGAEGHGLGPSPQQEKLDMTYLVDAQDGGVLLYYSESPWLDLPSSCTGMDELNTPQTFFGFQNDSGVFELRDPVRNLRTLDFQFGNVVQDPAPTSLVTNASFDFAGASTAAVSAHVNAMRVYDFYNDVLKRDSVDDKGMELVSVVNCTYQPPGAKEWKNAVWYQKRMWYGQAQTAAGAFASYSRYLDVIAHELTHGVTETTAALKYLNASGALSESFSDICGIIIKNVYGANPDDVSKWDWEIGSGLGKNGGPLRDLSDPRRTGQPDHMNDYQTLPFWQDSGGVHTNSNIHNKAAHHVMTARDAQGNFIFPPKQVALLYYLTLTRLSSFATFADVLSTMQNVIRTFWAGRPQEAQARIDAVVAAYGRVGIT
jgi:Zn-dependent metalloprotease